SQVITATWQATDCCSNTATCSPTVTGVDTTPPMITCQPGIGVICGTPWRFSKPTASDSCCGTNVTITVLNTVTNGHGCDQLITRTWLATDCCGNTNTCSQSIQVGGGATVVNCAPDKTVECGTGWLFDPPTATNVCCGTNFTITEVSTVQTNDSRCTNIVTRT